MASRQRWTQVSFLVTCLIWATHSTNVMEQVSPVMSGEDRGVLCSSLHKTARLADRAVSLAQIGELIENGTDDVYSRDGQRRTFLHVLLSNEHPISPSQFHRLAALLISKNHTRLFGVEGGVAGTTPLQLALLNVEVRGSTLTLLHQAAGVDWNGADRYGNSPLAYALMGRRRVNLLLKLIHLGAKWKSTNIFEEGLFHTAAGWGYAEGIEFLLPSGLDINALDKFGNSPLHTLVRNCNQRQVWRGLKLLIENGADVSILNDAEETPRSIAESRNFVNGDGILRALDPATEFHPAELDSDETTEEMRDVPGVCLPGTDFPTTRTDDMDETNIIPSITKTYPPPPSTTKTPRPVLQPKHNSTTCKDDFNVNARDADGNTELHRAAQRGDLVMVRGLVCMGADLNSKNKFDETPLHSAADGAKWRCGSSGGTSCLDVIDFLIGHGADVTAWSPHQHRSTFLMILLTYNMTITPWQLLKIAERYDGHLFNVADIEGSTPLHRAVEFVQVQIPTLDLLHKKGADFNAVNNGNQTVITYAMWSGKGVAVISKLIELGADYKRVDLYGKNHLHWAASTNNAETLAFLLKKGGLDINRADKSAYGEPNGGRTPLHFAAGAPVDPLQKVRLLLENGADKTIKDLLGETPLDWAKKRPDSHQKELILELLS